LRYLCLSNSEIQLFAILAWRDITVRYKQTVIGVAWALIRPFLTMLVFSALLPWQFFSTALRSCSDSLISNANLLTKVYIPRLIVPAAAVPFLVQFGLYVSPVGFSSAIVPAKWQLLYALNPMVGVIEGFCWAIIGKGAAINPLGFSLSMAIVVLLLVTGVRQFRRMEQRFADVI
jgi:ABC-type polysaccharide/polyol phosphate export permease